MKVGDLVKFVHAPGRWRGEKPRCPGDEIVGKVGVITEGPFHDSHEWGGVWNVECLGRTLSHWGDFMEVINESR